MTQDQIFEPDLQGGTACYRPQLRHGLSVYRRREWAPYASSGQQGVVKQDSASRNARELFLSRADAQDCTSRRESAQASETKGLSSVEKVASRMLSEGISASRIYQFVAEEMWTGALDCSEAQRFLGFGSEGC